MRAPLAFAVACLATILSAEAATTCTKYYKVVSGDTCSKIASKNSISVSNLKSWNTKINSSCNNLKVTESLCVKKSTVKTTAKKTTAKKTTTKKTTTKKTTTKKSTTKKTTTKKTTTKKTTTKKITTTKKLTTTKKSTTTKPATTTTKAVTTTTKSTTTSAAATSAPTFSYTDGLTVKITGRTNFCLFLPTSPGGKADNNGKVDIDAIAKSETSAVAFCLDESVASQLGANMMPDGFVEKAYYYKNTTAGYIQVTGTIDPSAYQLSPLDDGGQYDNHGRGAPANSMCYGYRYFVELIEPSSNDFCIRCCSSYQDCNAGRSTYGCKRVVSNGKYTA